VGLMYMVMYVVITVFIVGLMSGRTPEYLGMKITGRDVLLVMVTFLVHPIIILIPTVLAYATGAANAIGVSGSSLGFTQVLYEFTSAAANNGSDFFGSSANTVFFNLSTGFVMFAGRFAPIGLLFALAGSMIGRKRHVDWAEDRHRNFFNRADRERCNSCRFDILPISRAWPNPFLVPRQHKWIRVNMGGENE